MATVNITVKVKDYDGENKFQLGYIRQKIVVANAGDTIDFDQSDSSNAGHPLVIALYADGDHNTNGSEYTTGVTKTGTPGQAGAKTTFTVSDADLHGTYYYYCKNHAGMGGMIHYGSDSIPSGQTVPAKYRIIDEGATASDDQDGDITSSIETTAELYDTSLDPPWGVLYDSSLYQVSHTNPWAVINTDTRESAIYRVKYNVTDSGGLSAQSLSKFFNISDTTPEFVWDPETATQNVWSYSLLSDHPDLLGDYWQAWWSFLADGVCKFELYQQSGKNTFTYWDFGTYSVGTDGVAVGTMNFGGDDFEKPYERWKINWLDSSWDFAIPIMDPVTGEPLDEIVAPVYAIHFHSPGNLWIVNEENAYGSRDGGPPPGMYVFS